MNTPLMDILDEWILYKYDMWELESTYNELNRDYSIKTRNNEEGINYWCDTDNFKIIDGYIDDSGQFIYTK